MAFVSIVKPQIEAFNFNDLNERQSLKKFCTVTGGDLPLNITWLKDDKILITGGNRRVQQWDDFSIVLSLSTISVNDSGNYTCHAKNLAGDATYTSSLYVKGQFYFSAPFHRISYAFVYSGYFFSL